MSPSSRLPRQTLAHYSVHGAGTVQEPASITFNVNGTMGPGLEAVREALPETVTVEVQGIGMVLKGVDPAMSRTDLSLVFYDLTDRFHWKPKHHG